MDINCICSFKGQYLKMWFKIEKVNFSLQFFIAFTIVMFLKILMDSVNVPSILYV